MTILRGRPLSSVENQIDMMKPYVTRGVPISTKAVGGRTLQLAVPAEWTKSAGCLGEMRRFTDIERMKPGQAAALCESVYCPVIEQCLAAAMQEEHGLSAGNRYGVRGGKSPRERAALAFEESACERGHTDRWSEDRYPICLECKAEDMRARYAENKKDPDWRERKSAQDRQRDSVRRMSCLECGPSSPPMRVRTFARHWARNHAEEIAA